jgi:hypothetical protein
MGFLQRPVMLSMLVLSHPFSTMNGLSHSIFYTFYRGGVRKPPLQIVDLSLSLRKSEESPCSLRIPLSIGTTDTQVGICGFQNWLLMIPSKSALQES